MTQVSRPMQIALAATLLLAVVWFVALRPKPASSGAVAAPPVSHVPAKPATSAATRTTASSPRPAARTHAAAHHRRAAADPRVRGVRAALRAHKAVAIGFVSAAADAQAVAQELRHVSRFGGRAVVLAVPISQLSRYGFITQGVDVTVAPTIVIVDPNREATTIVGFSDRVEIEQRIADALAVKRGS